ncbi:MAG TPA: ABC transporter permease [Vicinamibacterales bacterium]|nr:ABC transporter permease [Vicinamibacterales bacterium]
MTRLLIEFFRDLRFGARLLRRSAGFTFTAVLSLGLGIGGATAVFSLVNAIVLRTLPVPDPQQLFQARSVSPGREYGDLFSGPGFEHARDELAARGAGELLAATSVAGMQLQPAGESIGARGNVQLVSGEYFTALRQQAQLGRLFEPSDNRTVGGHPVAVISDSYWRRHFGAAADAAGRTLAINGNSFTVIGVTRPRFFGTTLALRAPDAWIPFMMQPVVRYSQNASNSNSADPRKPWPPQPEMAWLNVFARVPGAKEGAESAMTTIFQRDSEAVLSKDATADDRRAIKQLRVILDDASTGLSSLRKAVSQPLYVLLAMVGVLLAIGCGNVAGLLLSRSAGRAREMAIRQSIGAGRLRLVRQMLAESLLLAVAAGLVGFTFAMWARDALLALMVNVGSSAVPPDLNTGLDWRVLAFSLAVSTLTGIGCGVLPAIRGTQVPLAEAMKEDGRGAVGEGGRRGVLIGKVLVAVQMAFCLLLLVVAGLFTRSLRVLTQTDIGFDRRHVLTVRADVRGAGYNDSERQALYRRLVESLQAVPGVESASLSSNGPLWGSQRISSLSVEGYTPGRDERLRTNEEIVTDRYFDTMGLKILEGRSFRAEDRAPGVRNTIVNATMARRFFKGQSAVGRRWDYGDSIGKDSQVIVGVVEDAKYVDLKGTPPNMAYQLADTAPDEVLSDIEVKTSLAPAALATTVRATLSRVEPRLPIVEVVSLEDRLARGVIQDRMVASLTSMFGGLALLLASLGLYGTISYGISRRVAEFGLRMALGADRGMVLWMVLREAMLLVLAGAVIGVPLAFIAGRSMSALLFGVGAADPVSFALGAATLLVVAAVAAYLPARRASRIEPMVALGR